MIVSLLAVMTMLWASPTWEPSEFEKSFPVANEESFQRGMADQHRTLIVVATGLYSYNEAAVRPIWEDPRVRERISRGGFVTLRYKTGQSGSDQAEFKDLISRRPGVLAFRSGMLIDHDHPFESAEAVIEWLDQVEKGPVSLEYARRRASVLTRPMSRWVFAERLERVGLADEAKVQLARVFGEYLVVDDDETVANPPDQFVDSFYISRCAERDSKLMDRLGDALLAQPDWKERVDGIRNELVARIASRSNEPLHFHQHLILKLIEAESLAPNPEQMEDVWKVLSACKGGRSAVSLYRKLAARRLMDRDNWEMAGRFIDRPIGWVISASAPMAMMDAISDTPNPSGAAKEHRERLESRFIQNASDIYAATLAAGRETQATLVAEAMFEFVDATKARGSLVRAALRAKAVRPIHLEWARAVDANEPSEPSLTSQVEAAVSKP